ncbi:MULTISPECIES: hypothetical protein [Bacillus]|uniref:hypothetical protein n=1 Tax=Bacillus TaxID=1386 RepID=UPI0021112ADF|nr:hypothetical protein [Bacillus paranthracis]MCQ6523663.1 hypothetical protein [Bacillus paranthracis]MCU5230748.1 hypothetical protein [Bacillus paranthracis]MEC4606149.1 hypothetical protein [Bacillus paranthracis]
MFGIVIFILLLLALIIIGVLNEKKGIIIYVIFSLVSPNLHLKGIQISFEIVAFFMIFLILIFKRSQIFSLYKNWPYRQWIWIYFFLIIISSLIAVIKYDSAISWIGIFGYFRVICVIYMLQYVLRETPEKHLDTIISPILIINLIVSVIQLSTPRSVQLFYDLYFKDSMTPLKEVLSLGYFNRAYGTFGTPVLLGVFALFAFALYLGYYVEKRTCRFLILKILMAVSCGLIALSKTAILGMPMLMIIIFILGIFRVIEIKNKKVLIIPFFTIAIGYFMVDLLEKAGFAISWYVRFLKNPFEAFGTRYDAGTGILTETYEIINQNLIFGVGPSKIGDAFVGDSMYINILYTSGILGFCIFFGVLMSSLFINSIKKNATAIMCSLTIILGGFAAPIHLNIVSVAFLAYIFSKAELNGAELIKK